jgi:hypothetical protein
LPDRWQRCVAAHGNYFEHCADKDEWQKCYLVKYTLLSGQKFRYKPVFYK